MSFKDEILDDSQRWLSGLPFVQSQLNLMTTCSQILRFLFFSIFKFSIIKPVRELCDLNLDYFF